MCSVCGVLATHMTVRKRGPEALCGEHLEWLQANCSSPVAVTAIVTPGRLQRRASERDRARHLAKAAYRASHREQIRAYGRASYQRHRADRIRKAKEYAAEHRDQEQAKRRAYYQRNRERLIENAKAYYRRNREAALAYQSARREQRKAAGKAVAH